MKIVAVIVAGGMGTRLGFSIPKAFVKLCNKYMLQYSVDAFDKCEYVNKIIIVVPADYYQQSIEIVEAFDISKEYCVIKGGKDRWISVKNGVKEANNSKYVIIHDAARPFVSQDTINNVIETGIKTGSAIAGMKIVDTIRTINNEYCTGTIDRSKLLRVSTPQFFKTKFLEDAYNSFNEEFIPTDEVMLLEHFGVKTAYVWDSPLNFKITTKDDFKIAEALITAKVV